VYTTLLRERSGKRVDGEVAAAVSGMYPVAVTRDNSVLLLLQ
jgi:hypothetical protein